MATCLVRLLSAALISLVLGAPADGIGSEMRYEVTIADPLKVVLPHRTALSEMCHSRKLVSACTWFAEERLSCSCERDGDRWRIVAAAHFVPVMFLCVRRPDVVGHEQSHIDDVRARLDEFLLSLTSRWFATEAECLREAGAASGPRRFVRTMNEFRAASTSKLDPP